MLISPFVEGRAASYRDGASAKGAKHELKTQGTESLANGPRVDNREMMEGH